MLTALAEQRHVLFAELSWTDDRLSLRGRRQHHADAWTWPTEDLRHGFYTAHPLTDKELIPTFERKADKVIGELEKIRRKAEYPRQRRQATEWRQRHEAEAAEREMEGPGTPAVERSADDAGD